MSAIRHFALLTLAFCLALCATAPAATITSLRLVPDGSADPPGDRLDISVLLAPGETEGVCEIRAYTLGANHHGVQPVRSHSAVHRDEKGCFLIRQPLAPKVHSTPDYQMAVPYADLDLSVGTYLLGYEATIKCPGKSPVTRATRLSEVKITVQTRTLMTVQHETIEKTDEIHQQSAVVARDPAIKTRDIDKRSFELATPRATITIESADAAVTIPGEFKRRMIPMETMRGDDSSPAGRDKLAQSATAWQPLSDTQAALQRIVYFATNRALDSTSTEANPQFTSEVADHLTVGKCVVNIPVQHQLGTLEQPTWWEPSDPNKHFLVESTQIVPQAQLFSEATAQDLLLFVHGFNNDFEFPVLRAAQLKYDLGFPGAAMAMCWPSFNAIDKYQQDRQQVDQSVGQMADLLKALIDRMDQQASGQSKPKLHLLAHSLGNELLLRAICELQTRGQLPENRVVFGQVILAAPDVGALEFNNWLPNAVQHSQRVTYYYSTHDAALAASRSLNLYEPVGLMAFFSTNLDTVNADDVDTSFFFHDYYASARQVMSDIKLLLNENLPPDKRMPPLSASTEVLGHPLWSFLSHQVASTAQ